MGILFQHGWRHDEVRFVLCVCVCVCDLFDRLGLFSRVSGHPLNSLRYDSMGILFQHGWRNDEVRVFVCV